MSWSTNNMSKYSSTKQIARQLNGDYNNRISSADFEQERDIPVFQMVAMVAMVVVFAFAVAWMVLQ